MCLVSAEESDFPSQVVGVLDAGVHALATDRAVDMCGVASKETGLNAEVGDTAVMEFEN